CLVTSAEIWARAPRTCPAAAADAARSLARSLHHATGVPVNPSSPRGEAAASRSADGTLTIRLAGPWHLQGGLPSPERLQQELHGQQPTRVVFDATALRGWDSSLVNFLVHVVERCQERSVPVDQDGLPSGVRRLIALAEAVPERKGARTKAAPPPFLDR